MTLTTAPKGADMVTEKITDLVNDVATDADRAVESGDREEVMQAIEEIATLVNSVEELKNRLHPAITRAFLLGVDPLDLVGKPYTHAYVLQLYNRTRADHPELPKRTMGRKFRRSAK